MMMQRNYHWILLAKHLCGECSEDECNQFRKILMDNPYLEAITNSLNNFWHTPTSIENDEILQEFWDRHIKRMQVKGIRFQNERI